MASRPPKTIAANLKTVRELERDIQEYLDAGRKIKKVPAGATGSPEGKRSKHIVITRAKERPRIRGKQHEGS